MVPSPVTTESPYGRLASIPKACERCLAYSSSSTKEPVSRSSSMRSRAVILPLACCFSCASSSLAVTASWYRAFRSAILSAVVDTLGASFSLLTFFTLLVFHYLPGGTKRWFCHLATSRRNKRNLWRREFRIANCANFILIGGCSGFQLAQDCQSRWRGCSCAIQ